MCLSAFSGINLGVHWAFPVTMVSALNLPCSCIRRCGESPLEVKVEVWAPSFLVVVTDTWLGKCYGCPNHRKHFCWQFEPMRQFGHETQVPKKLQNHRMFRVGRDLCGSSSPIPLPKQGDLQQAAQDLVQAGLEYLQRRRLHNLPGRLCQCSGLHSLHSSGGSLPTKFTS